MFRRSARFGVIFLCLLLFVGCAAKDNYITCDDIRLLLPESYVNLSDEAYAEDFDFLYGIGSEAVLGFKYDRATLETRFPGISAKEYAQKFVDAAHLSCEVTEQDGLVTFSYAETSDGAEITYLSAIFMTQKNVWVVQFYCPTAEYDQKQATFMNLLHAVQK